MDHMDTWYKDRDEKSKKISVGKKKADNKKSMVRKDQNINSHIPSFHKTRNPHKDDEG